MEIKTAVKIGLIAGIVSALFPSVPTMIFGARTWGSDYVDFLKWYLPLGLGVVAFIMVI